MPDSVRCAAIATLAALVACTPQLNGVCSSSAECHADETCSPDGLCLRKPDAGGPVVDGGPDAGSDAGPDAGSDAGPADDGGFDAGTDGGAQAVEDAGPDGVTVAAPAPGSFVRGGFAVAAVPGAGVGAATDVTFLLNVTGSDAGLGQLVVAAPLSGSQTYSGNFSVADPSFGGSAVLRAVLHRAAGGAAVVSASVPLIVDQVAPQITTSWDGGPWVARDGGLQVTAAVSDDRSGVASASLRVEDGGTYAAQLDGGTATFNVPAAELFAAGAAVARPFSLLVGDRAGNAGVLPTSPALVLRVDDQPPTIALAAIDSAQWRSGAFDLVGTLTDRASGVASASLLLGNTAIKGTAGAGEAWSFHATLGQTFPDFEGAAGFQVVAIDNAGNQADAGGIISVDTRPPAVLSVVPTTAPDYTAPDGKRWYKASGGTASITVQASIDGGLGSLIDPASLSASVDATSVGRNAQEPDFSFDLPRDAGQGFEGAKVVTVSAKDLAGNGPSVGTGSVNFDDQAPVLAAALASPTGWVRRSQPGGGVATTTIVVSLTENGSGVQSVRFRGGAAFAPAPAPAGTAFYGLSFDLSAAPQGAEGPLAFSVDTSDFVGNQASRDYFFNVDDVAPTASADNSNPLNSAWHSIAAGNLVFRATAVLIDNGSGVAAGPTLNGISGQRVGTSNIWQFPGVTLPSDPTLETAGYLLALRLQDQAGNPTVTTLAFKVDNQPPSIGDLKVDTAPDGTDGNGKTWYRGPHAGGTTNVVLSALVADTYLDAAAVVAVAGATRYPGTLSGGRWRFSIPRLATSTTFALDAADLAGNHAPTPPSVTLNFDDAGPPGAALNVDTAWYPRTNAAGQGSAIPVTATFASSPTSGYASVVLKVAGKADLAGTVSAGTWSFSLPTTYAPAGAEGPLAFNLVATSVTGISSTTGGTRRIDDAPPVFLGAAVGYVGGAGAQGYSHDGSHFNLRDVASAVFTFVDCGSGLSATSSAVVSYAIDGAPSTRSIAAAAAAPAYSCANGATPSFAQFTVSADLATANRASLPGIDNATNWQVVVHDQASSAAAHSSPGTATVNVTRRLWNATSAGAQRLAIGPRLFAAGPQGLTAFDLATGATGQWTSVAVFGYPVIASNGGSPRVYWLSGAKLNEGDASSLAAAPLYACAGPIGEKFSRFNGIVLADSASALASWTATTTTKTCECDPACPKICTATTCQICTTTVDSFFRTKNLSAGGVCTSPNSAIPDSGLAAVGRGARLYTSSLSSTTGGWSLDEMGFDGSNPSSQALAFSATGLLVTDNGTGNDALVVSGGSAASRIDYTTTFGNASLLGGLVAAAATAGAFAPAHVLGQGANNASLVDVDLATNARGQPVASAATTAIWAIDGQVGSPLAYVGNAGSAGAIVSYSISNGGLGAGSFPTLTLPASVDDLLLAADGTLYAAAGGSVYALQTDSPGLGTAAGGANASAWPTPARDACRSSNLSYSCPY